MYAVIATGGKQYRVSAGDKLKVEKLEAEVGATVEFDDVLLVGAGTKLEVGNPQVAGGKVTAAVLEHGRGKKITIVKMRRRKNSRRKMGHRQDFTEVEITQIAADNLPKIAVEKPAAAKAKKPAAKKMAEDVDKGE